MTFDEMLVASRSAAILRGSAEGVEESLIGLVRDEWVKDRLSYLCKTLRTEAAELQKIVDQHLDRMEGRGNER